MYDQLGDLILETRGEYRVSLALDTDPQPPDWDGQGTIIQLDTGYTGRAYVMHAGKAGEDFGLAYLWERWHDMALIERYLRMFHGVVGFDWFDDYVGTRGAKYVCVVTEDDLTEWGFEDMDAWRAAVIKHDLDPNPAVGNLNAWRHWIEGEVYGYVLEQRDHAWQTIIDFTGSTVRDLSDDDDWTEVESCWGYYGRKDAEGQARKAFSDYVAAQSTKGSVPA